MGLSAKGISKAFDGPMLFHDLTINLDENKKIALVGENGVGKSTLMRILAGYEEPDSGNVYCDVWTPRSYVAQEIGTDLEQTVYDFIEQSADPRRINRILKQFGFISGRDDERLALGWSELSGGQRKMLALAQALSVGKGFIFLDEPENHLDIYVRESLVNLLQNYHGGLMMVSHDHYIIDQVADQIVELEDGGLRAFSGTYVEYLAERERQIKSDVRDWQAQQKQIERLRRTVLRMRETARVNSDVAATYRNKKRQLEKMEETHGKKPTTERKRVRFTAAAPDKKGVKRVVIAENLSVGYNDSPLLSGVNRTMYYGEKVALVGPNGSGKTSFIKTLTGDLTVLSGNLRLGTSEFAVFGQDHDVDLDLSLTPLETLQHEGGRTEGACRAMLARMLFDQNAMTRRSATLSGGQKARLKFGKLLMSKAELLILDEPTNHLDATTWNVLSDLFKDWTGAILFVSHDRAFIDTVAEKLWVIDEGTIEEYLGSMTDYLEDG